MSSYFNTVNNGSRQKNIWAVAGGKGGVGRSFFLSSVGIHLASKGDRIVCIDADMNGANLHTFFGLHHCKTFANQTLQPEVPVSDAVIQVGIKQLELLTGIIPPMISDASIDTLGNILSRYINELESDHLLIDLGAGCHPFTLDAFLLANRRIVIIVPELTAIDSAYQFIWCAFLRQLEQALGKNNFNDRISDVRKAIDSDTVRSVPDMIQFFEKQSDPIADIIKNEAADFHCMILVNQAKMPEDMEIGRAMQSICMKYFGIRTQYIGNVEFDEGVPEAINQSKPFQLKYASSGCAKGIKSLISNLINKPSNPIIAKKNRETFQKDFDILEVSPNAYPQEIKLAYNYLKNLYSTDSISTIPLKNKIQKSTTQNVISDIDDAYHSLLVMFDHEIKIGLLDQRDFEQMEITSYSGGILRQIREKDGITLQEIAEATKIQAQTLEDIEIERYKALPPEIFIKGFVTNYANHLGLDSLKVVQDYIIRYRAWKREKR